MLFRSRNTYFNMGTHATTTGRLDGQPTIQYSAWLLLQLQNRSPLQLNSDETSRTPGLQFQRNRHASNWKDTAFIIARPRHRL